ncbi:MAG TPA: LysR substrate-binding domain-containing protein [Steroidobacteraceae bacterium]|nr:LysR substrate-binding domain-containing protein [Steroidobacteraceae bacterium]
MELRHLRYFVAVADTLNFRRAAERVHIEQSPLSQQIRNLEQELGVQLFTRTKRRVALTHAGRVFVGDAQAVLARANDGMERARRAARGSIGTLSFAYLTSMTNAFFVSVIHEFQYQYPGITLSFSDMVPNAVLNAVAQRAADVGFLRGVFSHEELAIEELGTEPLVVALPKDHPLTGKKKLAGSDLANEPFVMVPDEGSMGYNDVIRAYCRESGFSPVLRAEANQMQAVIWLVHLGLGLSLIPLSLKGLHRGNVVYRDLRDPPSISGKMVYRRSDNSPVLKNFVDLVLTATRRVPGWPLERPFPRKKSRREQDERSLPRLVSR